jgi:hypothetical protein
LRMTTEQERTARESDTARVGWDEIESVADKIFRVWLSGSGLLLARHAWEELAAAGQAHCETDLGRSEAIVRLLAFGAYYREFCVYAFDEGSVGEWREWITAGLIGDRPLLDASIFGELTTQPGESEDDFLEDAHAVSEVLQEIVQGECGSVVALLEERWGFTRFFASLYATGKRGFDGYPLTGEAVSEIVNYDVTGSKQRAWAWASDDRSLT